MQKCIFLSLSIKILYLLSIIYYYYFITKSFFRIIINFYTKNDIFIFYRGRQIIVLKIINGKYYEIRIHYKKFNSKQQN